MAKMTFYAFPKELVGILMFDNIMYNSRFLMFTYFGTPVRI